MSAFSITIVRLTNGNTRIFQATRALDFEPILMRQAVARMNAVKQIVDVDDAMGTNLLAITVDSEGSWGPTEQTVLAQLITGLGWADAEVAIYDRVNTDGEASNQFREHGRVRMERGDLVYFQTQAA